MGGRSRPQALVTAKGGPERSHLGFWPRAGSLGVKCSGDYEHPSLFLTSEGRLQSVRHSVQCSLEVLDIHFRRKFP